MSRAIVEMMRDRPGGGKVPRKITGEWKVVWANGDEMYVKAPDIDTARSRALIRHGGSNARIIYIGVYG